MDFFGGYKSPFGYENGDNGIDSYGVDHSGFSTQDELQYQTARVNREQQLADDLQQQGIAEENYPQYGLSFWGNSANNYGFGVRNIAQNTQNHPAMNMTPMQNLEPQEKNEYNSQVSSSTDVWSQQKNRNMENNLLMSGMDTLYGMNRAINGMTFGGLDYLGNKLGFDSQMNDIKNNQVETNDFGQNVYMSHGKNSDIKIVTSPTNNGVTVSSMYYPRK